MILISCRLIKPMFAFIEDTKREAPDQMERVRQTEGHQQAQEVANGLG